MKMTMREQAIARIHELLKHPDYTRPADIIADIIHYCATDLSFEDELETAREYVYEELGYDEEMLAD
jgi:hypothetical protein